MNTLSTIQAPSIENQPAQLWQDHAHLAYCFARHARHDLANVHCALGMLEMVEQIQADHPDMPLPEELNLDTIRTKARQDVKKVISNSNDLVLLSQAASTYAYKPVQSTSLGALINQNIVERLDNQQPRPDQLITQTIDTQVVAMGDMLGVALCAFYCQWTPWSQDHHNAAKTTVKQQRHELSMHIPADNVDILKQFAIQLASSAHDDPLDTPLNQHLTTSTGTMALWLARHIIVIHGGAVCIDDNAPEKGVTIYLPTVD
ncbi:MAG: hypothetical protein ACF8OB_17545 [Phycisphaeraceae bacterium JB051]